MSRNHLKKTLVSAHLEYNSGDSVVLKTNADGAMAVVDDDELEKDESQGKKAREIV
jgi:hypothetical protein